MMKQSADNPTEKSMEKSIEKSTEKIKTPTPKNPENMLSASESDEMPEQKSGEITKIIAVSSDSVLPADAARAAFASGYPVSLKETCYGLVVTGKEENVNAVVKAVQALDYNHIFVKDRGFPAGDKRRCRAARNGGQRPGFYTLHAEISRMGMVGDALDDYDAKVKKPPAKWPKKPSSFDMEDFIHQTLDEKKDTAEE
ncbi:methanogenesis marker 6 protein [Methanolapillus ohkumae]|uniref:Methanogenesis marker 6 protein n=1 Tax=Methanolapillus ohkumae TaxID=3028298 RepID=A0AA96V6T8_9EURY|nr:hypothetical protein MsAm2_14010 [Methanosarcinaceae archaeon Am2]